MKRASSGSSGQSFDSSQTSALPISPPVFTTEPQSQIVDQGSNALFSASATSAVVPGFQWLWNGSTISGATNAGLTLADVHPTAAGNYAVVASNYAGTITSTNAALIVRPLLSANPGGVFTWEGSFVLQAATNILGPYLDLPQATSPYANSNPSADQQYFRLRQ